MGNIDKNKLTIPQKAIYNGYKLFHHGEEPTKKQFNNTVTKSYKAAAIGIIAGLGVMGAGKACDAYFDYCSSKLNENGIYGIDSTLGKISASKNIIDEQKLAEKLEKNPELKFVPLENGEYFILEDDYTTNNRVYTINTTEGTKCFVNGEQLVPVEKDDYIISDFIEENYDAFNNVHHISREEFADICHEVYEENKSIDVDKVSNIINALQDYEEESYDNKELDD